MRQRCNNPKNNQYKSYGGRGIKFQDSWNDFKNFIEDMGKRPSDNHTLERKNVNGNYCKDNCIWMLAQFQNWNKRDTVKNNPKNPLQRDI